MKKIINIILKYKTYVICLGIVLLSIISVIMQSIDRKETLKVNNKEFLSSDSGKIAVYITGAVKNPGVYYINSNSRLYDILDICGGVLENADIENLNLAKKLTDAEKIVINEKKEDIFFEDTNNESVENVDKVNINSASKEELKTLTGIGDATAQKIIDYREENSFVEIEDIMNVEGIGESKFEGIKDDICV